MMMILFQNTRIEFIFACKMHPNFSVFLFSDFTKKIFCYYYVDIIVIAGICQNLFYDY